MQKVLFKMVYLSRPVDVWAISFKSLRFNKLGIEGTRKPLKSYSKDRSLNFRLKRFENKQLCVVEALQEYRKNCIGRKII